MNEPLKTTSPLIELASRPMIGRSNGLGIREALARQQYEASNRGLMWDDAKCAARDAYCRLQQNRPTSDLPNRSTDEVPSSNPVGTPNRPR